MGRLPVAAFSLVAALAGATTLWSQAPSAIPAPAAAPAPASLESAQRAFYSGQYEQAAATTLAIRTADPSNLAAYELRSSALHFRIKRLMGDGADRDRAFKQCAACPVLLAEFQAEIALGQAAARAQLAANADDDNARFFLGKSTSTTCGCSSRRWAIAPVGIRYWEARKAMDLIISASPCTHGPASHGPGSTTSWTRA